MHISCNSELLAPLRERIDTMSDDAAVKRKWILVISNEPTIRDIVDRFLRLDGHLVLTAADYEEGLGKARLLPVSLVVLDVDLQGPNGIALRTKLKNEAATVHLPVLLISSRLPQHDLQKMADSTDGFLTTPFSLKEVLVTVNRLLGPTDELTSHFSPTDSVESGEGVAPS
jgi:DNA-binding response OmpR family regulator